MNGKEPGERNLGYFSPTPKEELHMFADERYRCGRLGSYSSSPVRYLTPGKKVARETKKQGNHQKENPGNPIEIPGPFVRAVKIDPCCMEYNHNYHKVCPPMVETSYQPAERYIIGNVDNTAIGFSRGRAVMEQQQYPGAGSEQKKEEADPAEAKQPIYMSGDRLF